MVIPRIAGHPQCGRPPYYLVRFALIDNREQFVRAADVG